MTTTIEIKAEIQRHRKNNRSLSPFHRERNDQLIGRHWAETPAPEDCNELIALPNQIEAANVRRTKD